MTFAELPQLPPYAETKDWGSRAVRELLRSREPNLTNKRRREIGALSREECLRELYPQPQTKRASTVRPGLPSREEALAIRQWAASVGMPCSPRGRIAASVVDAYRAEQDAAVVGVSAPVVRPARRRTRTLSAPEPAVNGHRPSDDLDLRGLSVGQLADYWGIKPEVILDAAKRGEFPPFWRVGTEYIVRRSDVEAYMAGGWEPA